MQGIAGGIAGGLLGSMLFGGTGHAASGGGMGGSGIGLFEILILGLLAYFGYRFYKRRRAQPAGAGFFGNAATYERTENPGGQEAFRGEYQDSREGYSSDGEVERGFQQIRISDPGFNETKLKEELEDLFFRIQASWTNRSLSGIEDKITGEMNEFFVNQFNSMNQSGISNHLENIAVRQVEPAEVWQETDKDYVTVLFTASLLDYTLDYKTGAFVSGDKINPVKFREFWTFCRQIGTRQWKLSAIDQLAEPQ
jgi:predicted lipid-binding transport protein (Tim44 family)